MAATARPIMAELMEGQPLDIQDLYSRIFNLGVQAGVDATLAILTEKRRSIETSVRHTLLPVDRQAKELERLHAEALAENARRAFAANAENDAMPFNAFIEDLRLTARTYVTLTRNRIYTVGELVHTPLSALRAMRNFGSNSEEEVKATLAKYDYVLLDDTL